jgi:hypothetical protein
LYKKHTTVGAENWFGLGLNLMLFGLIAMGETEMETSRFLEKGRDATGLATTIFSASSDMFLQYYYRKLVLEKVADAVLQFY